jgi:hypothetical protein
MAALSLDKSGWSSEALERATQFAADKQAFKALASARLDHPFSGALDQASDASLRRSNEGAIHLKHLDFGNGHQEVTIWRTHPDLQGTLDRAIDRDLAPLVKAVRGEGDREASIEAATRRAKQRVRHLAKAMIVNSLWTLTYRENVTDRERVLKDLDRFRRRVSALFGQWRYIAVLEFQQRGAYHIHLATHALPARLVIGGAKVKSWDVMRRIWRDIVGTAGGNFDESKRGKRWGGQKPVQGAGNIARYLAGYVAKDLSLTGLNRKRFSHSEGVDVPQAYRALFPPDTPWTEMMSLALAAMGPCASMWFDPERGVFFVECDQSLGVG